MKTTVELLAVPSPPNPAQITRFYKILIGKGVSEEKNLVTFTGTTNPPPVWTSMIFENQRTAKVGEVVRRVNELTKRKAGFRDGAQ